MDDITGSSYPFPYSNPDRPPPPVAPPAAVPPPTPAPPEATGYESADPQTAFIAQRYGLTPDQMRSTAITPTYQDRLDAASAGQQNPQFSMPQQQERQPFMSEYPFHKFVTDEYQKHVKGVSKEGDTYATPWNMDPEAIKTALDKYADGPVKHAIAQQVYSNPHRIPAGTTAKDAIENLLESYKDQMHRGLPTNLEKLQNYFKTLRPADAAATPPPRGFLDEMGHSIQDLDTGLIGGAARGVGGLALAGGGLASMVENLTGAPPGIVSDKLFAGTQALNKYANNLPKPESTFGQVLQGAGALIPGILTGGAGAGAAAADTLEKTGDLKRAEIENAIGGVTNLAGAPLGVAGGANPLTRAVVQGAGNVGAYELGRRLENAGLPEDQQRPFDPVEAGLSGGVGALFGGLSKGTFADELRRFRGSPNAQTPPAGGGNTEGAGARPNGSFTPDNTPLGPSPAKAANDAAVRAASVVSSARDRLKAKMGIAPGSPVEKPFDAETDRLINEAGAKARADAAAQGQPAGATDTGATGPAAGTKPEAPITKPLDTDALTAAIDDHAKNTGFSPGEGKTPQEKWDSEPVRKNVNDIINKVGPLSPEDTVTALNAIKDDWATIHDVDPSKVTVKAPDTTGEDDLARAAGGEGGEGGESDVPGQAPGAPKPVPPAPINPIHAANLRILEAKAQTAEAIARAAKEKADAQTNKIKRAEAAAQAKEAAAQAEAAREEADRATEAATPEESPEEPPAPEEAARPFSPADLQPQGPTSPLSAKPKPFSPADLQPQGPTSPLSAKPAVEPPKPFSPTDLQPQGPANLIRPQTPAANPIMEAQARLQEAKARLNAARAERASRSRMDAAEAAIQKAHAEVQAAKKGKSGAAPAAAPARAPAAELTPIQKLLAHPVVTSKVKKLANGLYSILGKDKGGHSVPVKFKNPDDQLAYILHQNSGKGGDPHVRSMVEEELIDRGYSEAQLETYPKSVSDSVIAKAADPMRAQIVIADSAPVKGAGTPVTKKGNVKYATKYAADTKNGLSRPDLYKLVPPDKVKNESIFADDGQRVHEDPNRAYTKNLIKPRHAADEVMLKVRSWDRDNPDESLKMQWLMKHVFPGDSPEEIYSRIRGSKEKDANDRTVTPGLWSVINAEARDNPPSSSRAKVKVESGVKNRPLSFRTGDTGSSSVEDVRNAVNGIGKGSRHIDVTNSHEQPTHAEPIGKGEQPVGYYDRANGRITLFADRIGGPAEARWTAWHELVHRGIDVEHGDAYGKALEDLEKNNGVKDLAKVIAERRGYDMEQLGQRHDAIEEAAAEIGAADAENNFGALKDRYGVDVQAKALDGITWRKPFEALKKIWQHITGMSHDEVLDFVRQARQAGESNRPSTIWGRAESQAHLMEPPKYATRSPEDQTRAEKLKAANAAALKSKEQPSQTRAEKLKAANAAALNRSAGGENAANDSPAKLTRKSESIQKVIKESDDPGKVVKGLRAWAYMSMLTHLRTLPKIFATSTGELGVRPLEEIFGGALSKIMPDSIVNQAERYGHGLSAKGARAAIENLFNGKAYAEMAMKGTTYMDRMFDDLVARHKAELDANPELKKHVLEVIENFQTGLHERPGLMNLPGRVHGLLHSPPMLAEHAYSLVKRQENFVRRLKAQGMSDRDAMVASSHPLAQLDMQIGAYKDALSAAYRGDNAIMRMYKGLSELLHEKGGGMGPTIANVLDIMNPFMRVSSNLFSRGTDFLAGGLKAAGEARNANRRMAKNKALKEAGLSTIKDSDLTYTPAEADYIMRTLRSQGVGAAALLMGTLAWKAMGGLYQKDEYFRKDKPEQGTMKIGNTVIPKIYMEHPLLQIMQMGAMVARGAHEKGTDRAIGNAKEGGLDMADVLSFSRNTGDISKALESGDNALRFVTQQVMNRAIPGVIPDTAHIQDLHDTQDHDWMKSFINYTFGDQTVHRIVRKEKGDTLAAAKNYAKSQLPKTPLNPLFNRQSLPKRD